MRPSITTGRPPIDLAKVIQRALELEIVVKSPELGSFQAGKYRGDQRFSTAGETIDKYHIFSQALRSDHFQRSIEVRSLLLVDEFRHVLPCRVEVCPHVTTPSSDLNTGVIQSACRHTRKLMPISPFLASSNTRPFTALGMIWDPAKMNHTGRES